jgi:methionine-rich copper-binding protein CopC
VEALRSTVVTVRGRGAAGLLLVLAAGTTLGMTVLAAGPAQAHATVVATVPAEQAALDTPPDLVSVEFSEPVLDVGTEIKVLVAGQTLLDDRAAVDGTRISHPLGGELPAGSYQVLWRATSVDGHVVSGAYLFSVAAGASRPPAPTLGLDSQVSTATPATGSGSTGSGGGRAQWVLAALAAAGAGLAVLGSRRRVRSAARE